MDLAEEGPGQKASSGNLVFANRTGTLLGEITKSAACPDDVDYSGQNLFRSLSHLSRLG
jgi:hypothetical protein